jgi:hypothetical protein
LAWDAVEFAVHPDGKTTEDAEETEAERGIHVNGESRKVFAQWTSFVE